MLWTLCASEGCFKTLCASEGCCGHFVPVKDVVDTLCQRGMLGTLCASEGCCEKV